MTQLTILTPAEKRQLDSPPQFTQQDRQRYFFMSGQLRSIVSRIRRQDNKIGFVLQWGYFCSRARFYPADQFKQRDIAYVKRLFKCDDVDLSNYAGTVVTRHRHRILETLDWQEADETDREQLYQQALRQARHQDFPQDIFSALVDTCWKQQIVVPSYHDLNELITQSYISAEQTLLATVQSALTAEHTQHLEGLLRPIGRASRATLAITTYKTIDQSVQPKHIANSAAILQIFRKHFMALETAFTAIALSDKATRYYATWFQKADFQQLSQFPNRHKLYLHLLGFIQHQFYQRQDSLVDVVLKSVTATNHRVKRELGEHDQKTKRERDYAIQALSTAHRSAAQFTKDVVAVVGLNNATPNEKYYKIEALVADYESTDASDLALIDKLEDDLKRDSQQDRYYALMEGQSIKLQRRVSAAIKVLEFDSESDATDILEAIYYFKETAGALGRNPPIAFLTTQELAAVRRDGIIVTSLYKCLLFLHIADAIKAGQLNLRYSYRYRAVRDYLIEKQQWQQNKAQLLRETGLLAFADGDAYLESLEKVIDDRYTQVNERFLAGDNPYMSVDDKGYCRVRTPSIDADKKSFISSTLSQTGYVPILQVLKEVNRVSGFIRSFKHLSPKHHKMKPTEEILMAGIVGNGCNIGISKLASISSGIREHTLHNTVTWYFDINNIRAANRKIIDVIHRLALANNYLNQPSVIHSSSDGRKVNVAVDCLHASYSYKYFGKEKGVTDYTFIDERQSLFHNTVFSASDREAPYVIDGLVENPVPEGQVHSTDTHGFSESIFATTHFIGVAFAPRLKSLGRQKMYGFSTRGSYKKRGYKLLPSRSINKKLILKHWDDILRFMATIKTHHASASLLFKRLSSYAKDHPLYKALKEFGRIIKTQFILTFFDDVELRQQIQKQLSRVEQANKFSHAVFFDNDQAFQEGGRDDQELVNGCKLLLQNAIILWNYLYLSELVVNTPSRKDRSVLLDTIRGGSVITWKHINLRGQYDFRRKSANDPMFDFERIKALRIS
tara:strand:+ start:1793 stop:4840 length:3048 start_codon:yes stop_codon:yes gene_type:complete